MNVSNEVSLIITSWDIFHSRYISCCVYIFIARVTTSMWSVQCFRANLLL